MKKKKQDKGAATEARLEYLNSCEGHRNGVPETLRSPWDTSPGSQQHYSNSSLSFKYCA